mgnify:CR=1 FL=1
MLNPGEEIVGEYLKLINSCDFVEYNLYTPDIQGEIDVVGINAKDKTIYICEVATHLITGLQYTKNNRPDNVARFCKKFKKNIPYARKYFPDYKHHFMIWSPVVKTAGVNAKNNQLNDIETIKENVYAEFDERVEVIANHNYAKCLQELRDYAAAETKELQSPIMRLMQVEEHLMRHNFRLTKKGIT